MGPGRVSRRDFLGLARLIPPAILHALVQASGGVLAEPAGRAANSPNILILLFDTLSASHTTLEGYRRGTTPNLERFARRAVVYHNHYSAGNFTVPGTASLLTGLYPWTHRANQYGGKVPDPLSGHSLFSFVGPEMHRVGYSQNPYADTLLYQFERGLDRHLPSAAFQPESYSLYDRSFRQDAPLAYQAVDKFALRHDSGLPSAQILSALRYAFVQGSRKRIADQVLAEYPDGPPFVLGDVGGPYTLAGLVSGAEETLRDLPSPFMGYFHFFPPHAPYVPPVEFRGLFDDGWIPADKPRGVFPGGVPRQEMLERQQRYDEFLAATDAHLGVLLDFLERGGFFEDSYIMITSDHGELFERGVYGHTNDYLYEPLVRVPLLVSAPGQRARVDVHQPTSSVDVLPTILALLGREPPPTLEGVPLPGFGGALPPDPGRAVYAFVSKSTPARGALGAYTLAMRQGDHKLIKYKGYSKVAEAYELYDLRDDPEERENRFRADGARSKAMREALNARIAQIDPAARE